MEIFSNEVLMVAIEDMPILAQTTGMRSYEELCESSRILARHGDHALWRIGDNAIEVVDRFGTVTLADYAREIGKPKGTVYEAHSMAVMYNPQVRSEIEDECPNITRSHMRKCLSLHDPDKARSFVEHASMRGWTVDQFGLIMKRYRTLKGIGKPAAPRPVTETFYVTLHSGLGEGVTILVPDHERLWETVVQHPGAVVTVSVTWTPGRGGDQLGRVRWHGDDARKEMICDL